MGKVRRRWRQLGLAKQYMLVSFGVFASVAVLGGWWISEEIEAGVVHRTAETTALYVDSFVSPSLQDVEERGALSPRQIAMLSRVLTETPLGREIVAFKIWSTDGRVLFSNEPEAMGQQFPPTPSLMAATRGDVVSEVSTLQHEENQPERVRFSRLLETYSPVHASESGRVIAVVEFYQRVDELERDLADSRQRVWVAVTATALAAYLLLAGMVKRASDTIGMQQRALADSVDQLTALVGQNRALHDRARRAAARSTALNEQYLRRISAELHDGPAQDVSFALLRLQSVARLTAAVGAGAGAMPSSDQSDRDVATIEGCLRRAMGDLRGIAGGLRLPELESLTLVETIERVVQIHERRTGSSVSLTIGNGPEDVPLPAKITAFRVIQEALTNAFRHAGGWGQAVDVASQGDGLVIQIADAGREAAPEGAAAEPSGPVLPGPSKAGEEAREHLGLAVMRERVESIGGRFAIVPRSGGGTVVRATIPLDYIKSCESAP